MALEDAETGMPEPEQNHGNTRRDLRMEESAIKKGWIIPEALMRKAPERMERIIDNGNDREAVQAAKVVDAMFKTNIQLETGPDQSHGQDAGVIVYIPSNNRDVQIGVTGE